MAQRQELVQQAQGPQPLLVEATLLETQTARANPERSYLQTLSIFVPRHQQNRQDWSTCVEFDLVPSSYISNRYGLGTSCTIGGQATAVSVHGTPPLFRQTDSALPRALRASAAWMRRAPGKARLSRRRPAGGATASRVVRRGPPGMTSPPGVIQQTWPLGEPTTVFSGECQALKLSLLRPHLYSRRHGGASDDLLTGRRSPLEVQRRGRWAVASSMRRYGKEGSLLDEMARVNAEVFAFGALVEANFSSLLEHGFSRMNLYGQVPATVLPTLGPVAAAAVRRGRKRSTARR